MKQTLKSNDPRLTAYALGELTREETAEIAQQLQGNLKLQKEIEEIDSFGLALSAALGNNDAIKLSPSQRSTIFQSGRTPTSEDIISIHKKQWLRPVIVTLGAAAVLTLSFVWLNNMAGREDLGGQLNMTKIDQSDLIAPITPNQSKWNPSANNGVSNVSSNTNTTFENAGNTNIENMGEGLMHHPVKLRNQIEKTAASDNNLVEISENDWEMRGDKAMTRLPLVCGNASWKWMEQWVATKSTSNSAKPSKNAVRIEEIINHFHYSHPADIQIGNIHTGISLVQCPWDANHQIAIVLMQNRSDKDSYVEAAVTMSEAVSKYRLIGYAKTAQPGAAQVAPTKVNITAGYSHLCMYEIELNDNAEIGNDVLTLSVNTQQADALDQLSSNSLNVQHSDLAWSKAPQDVQFSLILASWAQIIADSAFDGEMNAQKVQGMVSYFETVHVATKEQNKALHLIKKSLK